MLRPRSKVQPVAERGGLPPPRGQVDNRIWLAGDARLRLRSARTDSRSVQSSFGIPLTISASFRAMSRRASFCMTSLADSVLRQRIVERGLLGAQP